MFYIRRQTHDRGGRIKSYRRRRTAKIFGTGLVLAAILTYVGLYLQHHQSSNVTVSPRQPMDSLTSSLNQETVMVIGGSMAHGWKDPHDDSYLKRAFQSLTNSTNTKYIYDDQSIIGGRAVGVQQKNELPTWLNKDKPNIVVISWGLLDDAYDKTPIDQFANAIHDEISQCLNRDDVVMIITPPVVQATATYYHSKVEAYIEAEFKEAASFQNGNVYCFNLNDEMSKYMAAHGQTYQLYKGDSWHPNQAGHELGGKLLFNDFVQTFGSKPIQYGKNKVTTQQTK